VNIAFFPSYQLAENSTFPKIVSMPSGRKGKLPRSYLISSVLLFRLLTKRDESNFPFHSVTADE
jgi:hypothetical protein